MTQGNPSTTRRPGQLQTTAGDWEIETRSRRHNALEAIGLYTFLMVVQWPFCYIFGTWMENEAVKNFAWYPVILGAVYLLLASPFLHKDSLESWGLGNPKTLVRILRTAALPQRLALGGVEVHAIGGNHDTALRRPHVAGLAEVLGRLLEAEPAGE
ncbi:MAG: hypothetical protein HC897_17535 [Thermoanaerobaculia bacterium]|nr:hypothetical protein [Thermoanaerobaculia bacterium]